MNSEVASSAKLNELETNISLKDDEIKRLKSSLQSLRQELVKKENTLKDTEDKLEQAHKVIEEAKKDDTNGIRDAKVSNKENEPKDVIDREALVSTINYINYFKNY